MAKSEKDEEQKYLVELECVKLVSLRNMGKLGRPYGKKKWEDCRIFAFLPLQGQN